MQERRGLRWPRAGPAGNPLREGVGGHPRRLVRDAADLVEEPFKKARDLFPQVGEEINDVVPEAFEIHELSSFRLLTCAIQLSAGVSATFNETYKRPRRTLHAESL